jgi:hypothetical protein
MNLPELNVVLEYENPRVLKLYEQNHSQNNLSAKIAFTETLKYLWLTQRHAQDLKENLDPATLPRDVIMLRSMREIDEMWHEFILFTEDYSDFCQRYFGRYIHHLPNVFDNMPMTKEEEEEEISKLLPYIYDHLGEDTMRIWFATYLGDPALPKS